MKTRKTGRKRPVVAFTLSPEVDKYIDELAKARQLSRSVAVEEALREHQLKLSVAADTAALGADDTPAGSARSSAPIAAALADALTAASQAGQWALVASILDEVRACRTGGAS